MIKAIYSRLKQGYKTIPFPAKDVHLPERFLGQARIHSKNCREDCLKCKEACPIGAIDINGKDLSLDLGKCIFCGDCQRLCPGKAITFNRDYRLAAQERKDLIARDVLPRVNVEKRKNKKHIFGRSLKLRQVSAGGCNGCELDINVLNTVTYDLGRFGVQFVASPRHADGIVVTGPVTENILLAVEKTYKAIPDPKLVIAVGACAISGGPYAGHKEAHDGIDSIFPVDIYIPGCPPHPLTILDGLISIMGR